MTLLIVALMALGLLLVVSEIFVPGGVLGTIGVLFMLGAVGLCYLATRDVGLASLLFLFSIAVSVTILIIGFKVLPRTPVGRQLFLSGAQQRSSETVGDIPTAEELVGKEGTAESVLRPSGTAMIEGRRLDVISDGEYIVPGAKVRVVEVDGLMIRVTQV